MLWEAFPLRILPTRQHMSRVTKNGKKKFSIACKDAHENALAQIYKTDPKYQFSMRPKIKTNYYYVALVYRDFNSDAKKWDETYNNAVLWSKYQPFSTEPSIISSYIASTFLGKQEDAQNITEEALNINKNNFPLLNNQIYALIMLGCIDEANKKLSQINIDSLSRIDGVTLTATKGLLKFREKNILEGRALYEHAASLALELSGDKSHMMYLRVLIFHAKEEMHANNDIVDIIKLIKKGGSMIHYPPLSDLIKAFGIDIS